MERGRFEDIISKKFEGESQQVPSRIWENVGNSLNADLVSKYQSSHVWYRWLTAAAILIAVSVFAIQYVGFSLKNEENTATYNALLSEDADFSQFSNLLVFDHNEFIWQPIAAVKEFMETSEDLQDSKSENRLVLYTIEIVTKKPTIELAETENSIAPYYRILHRSVSKTPREKTFWAGLGAGAGKFNPNHSGSNSLSSSVNSTAAASAIGAGDFVNPSANAIQNGTNEGVATSVGVDFGLKIGEKWTLESGLAYTSINNSSSASISVLDVFSSNGGDVIAGKATPNEFTGTERLATAGSSVDGDVDLNSNIQFASLPLKAGYYLMDNRFSLRLNAGVSANYLIENSLSDPSRQIINSAQPNLYNDWSFDGIGGLEFGYRLFDKIDMTIEPNFRHSITPLSNTISSPSRFAIQTGFRYTLR